MTKGDPSWTCACCCRSARRDANSDICQRCKGEKLAQGLRWCRVGRHFVREKIWRRGVRACASCASGVYRTYNQAYRPRPAPPDGYSPLPIIAEQNHIGMGWLQALARAGKIPAVRVGGRWFLPDTYRHEKE